MNVIILKTNIRYKKQVKSVAPLLDQQDSIYRWNIDLNDVDKVLRIESTGMQQTQIVQLINEAGFHCEELAD